MLDLSGGSARLLTSAMPAGMCASVSGEVYGLEISRLALVKAFHPSGSADSLAPVASGLDWLCELGSCASLPGHTAATTLRQAVEMARGPLSARVASHAPTRQATAEPASDGGFHGCSSPSPQLQSFLTSLEERTGREWMNADVYLTTNHKPSASLGWHIDDVDVLLVLLNGRKR